MLDTNSLGLSLVSHVTMHQQNEMMDQMLALWDSEGIMQIYFSNEVIRLDIGVTINALSPFNEFGKGDELQDTEDWFCDTLRTRAHDHSSHYYTTADITIYFVSRLLEKAPRLRSKFQPLLHDCLLERKAAITDSMSMAIRLIVAARYSIQDDAGVKTLIMCRGIMAVGRLELSTRRHSQDNPATIGV